MAVVTTLLAFMLWNYAVKNGNMVLLASLSHLTPLLSMLVTSLYLQVAPSLWLWLACGLVVAGAVICRFSVIPRAEAPQAPSAETGPAD